MKVNKPKYAPSLILAVLLAISIFHSALASEITIIPSPPLPVDPINPKYSVDFLSGDGLVVAGSLKNYLDSEEYPGNTDYFGLYRWTKQGGFDFFLEIEDMYLDYGGTNYLTTELSYNGSAVGFSVGLSDPFSGLYRDSFRLTETDGLEWLSDPEDDFKMNESWDISSDATVVVGWWGFPVPYGYESIFIWKEDMGRAVIAPPEDCTFNSWYGPVVSGDGHTVVVNCVDSADYDGPSYFLKWTESGAYQWLGDGTAVDISTDGNVIVGTTPEGQAFRYTDADGVEEIGNFSPRKTNGDGSLIVGGKFIWSKNDGLQSIEDYLESKNLQPGGWFFASVKDISDDGLTILGTGYAGVGSPAQGWLATIDENAVVVDNGDTMFSKVGSWHLSDKAEGFYFTNYAYAFGGDGSAAATFTFQIPADGDYAVAAQWPQHSSRAPDAPYTLINNASVVDTVRVNQRINGGRFNPLTGPASRVSGNYALKAGVLEVTLSNDAAGKVAADAVRVTRLPAPVIIDNTDDRFSKVGSWKRSDKASGFYGSDYFYSFSGNGASVATFTVLIPVSGEYRISAQWPAHDTRASNAPFRLVNNGSQLDIIRVNQKVNGGQFNPLTGLEAVDQGIYPLNAGVFQVILTNDADGKVAADAVRIEHVRSANL